MKKAVLSLLLRIAVSLALIILLLYFMRGKYGEIISVLSETSVSLFCLAVLVYIIAILAASLRLKIIVDAQGAPGATFMEAASLTFMGYFFNNFLPTSIGGDVVKGYYHSKKTGDRTASYTSIFIDRAIGLFTMVFMAFAALFFVNDRVIDKNVKSMIYAITIVSALIIIFLANKKIAKKFSILLILVRPIEDKLKKVYNAVNKYKHNSALIFRSIVISIASQLLFFISIGILAMSIGTRIPIMDILLKMPIISMMSMLPSINGLGLREGSTVLLFGPIIGKENAFAVSVLWLFVLFVISVAGGAIYGLSPQFRVKFKDIK